MRQEEGRKFSSHYYDRFLGLHYTQLLAAGRTLGFSPASLSHFVNGLSLLRIYLNYLKNSNRTKKLRSTSLKWVSVAESMQEDPHFINFIRLIGPRWNCFALLGMVRPFKVNSRIAVDTSDLSEKSESWSLVIYDKKRRTVAHITSEASEEKPPIISLKKGTYGVSYRYYTSHQELICPTLTIDGGPQVRKAIFPEEKERYEQCLQTISKSRHPMYLLQQFYVFDWLKNRDAMDKRKVERAFLPVGDPNNVFDFGYLVKEECISLRMSPETLAGYQVYLAYYNELSLPLFWTRITEEAFSGVPIEENGAYLIRFVPRSNVDSRPPPEFHLQLNEEL
ncbi:MAG: DUF6208 family protein [Verrucomicrobiota bacterium]